ncbi:hypothetical protein [Moorena sp. SIO3H5]|nr:hypothetical protein [Moorena sp. SIO3H5]
MINALYLAVLNGARDFPAGLMGVGSRGKTIDGTSSEGVDRI